MTLSVFYVAKMFHVRNIERDASCNFFFYSPGVRKLLSCVECSDVMPPAYFRMQFFSRQRRCLHTFHSTPHLFSLWKFRGMLCRNFFNFLQLLWSKSIVAIRSKYDDIRMLSFEYKILVQLYLRSSLLWGLLMTSTLDFKYFINFLGSVKLFVFRISVNYIFQLFIFRRYILSYLQ